ncbi:MAG: SMC-Scp complex subunit ScpB [Pseudomonadota bacterium]
MAETSQQRKPASDLFEPAMDEQAESQALRVAEALLFAAQEPMTEELLAKKLGKGVDAKAILETLAADYANRGVTLRRIAGKWMFRTADDLSDYLRDERVERKTLTRAQLETLAIVVYHQPVTRAEIEDIRGVTTSKGTLDILLTTGWIRMRGRRKAPGRPVTYGTTEEFLMHFGLDSIKDLPGLDELRGAGLLDTRLPTGFSIPSPNDGDALGEDEDPLDAADMLEPLQEEDIQPEANANENEPDSSDDEDEDDEDADDFEEDDEEESDDDETDEDDDEDSDDDEDESDDEDDDDDKEKK